MNKIPLFVVSVVVSVLIVTSILVPFCSVQDTPTTLDVIIIDGQSNAEDRPYFNSAELNQDYANVVPKHNLYYFGDSSRPIRYGDNIEDCDLHKIYDNEWKVGGYAPLLSYKLSERSNNDVLVINTGIGGKSISFLTATGTGGIWAFDVIDAALSKVHGYNSVNILGWIWAQGEQDKAMPVDEYKQYFYQLQTKFMTIGANDCYIIATRPYYGGNATIAQNELIQANNGVYLGSNLANTFTADSPYLVSGDPIHISQIGRNAIALELGEVIHLTPSANVHFDVIKSLLSVIPLIVIAGIICGTVVIIKSKTE